MTTPAFDAWLRACAEYLRDNRPEIAVYDVDPAALRTAFSLGTAPRSFLSADPIPLAKDRDSALLPFFREDVRTELALSRPDIELHDLPHAAIQGAYSSGLSPAEFVEREVPPARVREDLPPPSLDPIETDPARRTRFVWAAFAGGLCVALIALALLYSSANHVAGKTEATGASLAAEGQSPATAEPSVSIDRSSATSDSDVQLTTAPEGTEAPSSTASTKSRTTETGNPGTALNPPGGPIGDQTQRTPNGERSASASHPEDSDPATRPSVNQFYATYSATGDDSNPWRMTLHWQTTNVERVELSYGNTSLSDVDTPQGEFTLEHDPDTNGPIRPGTVFTIRGFNGNRVSTRAVTADPPP
jgi:hypothetical protein